MEAAKAHGAWIARLSLPRRLAGPCNVEFHIDARHESIISPILTLTHVSYAAHQSSDAVRCKRHPWRPVQRVTRPLVRHGGRWCPTFNTISASWRYHAQLAPLDPISPGTIPAGLVSAWHGASPESRCDIRALQGREPVGPRSPHCRPRHGSTRRPTMAAEFLPSPRPASRKLWIQRAPSLDDVVWRITPPRLDRLHSHLFLSALSGHTASSTSAKIATPKEMLR